MCGRIAERRQAQPIEELKRKQRKARRRDKWTQEDLDLAAARAASISRMLRDLEERQEPLGREFEELWAKHTVELYETSPPSSPATNEPEAKTSITE